MKSKVCAESNWAGRARYYNHLKWAKDRGYLKGFIKAGDFKSFDNVLDVGTGTGIVAHALSDRVNEVTGIDISRAMLRRALSFANRKTVFRYGDVTKIDFCNESFDKVTARMVYHHLDGQIGKATAECFRVLKPGGVMVLSEGVPPHRCLEKWYSQMFALKEERLTFFKEDLVWILKRGGFKSVKTSEFVSKGISIRNWLRNSAICPKVQEEIFKLHLGLGSRGRRLYNMRVKNNDILVDFKYVIVSGKKI